MKKSVVFSLFILITNSLFAQHISVQGVLRDSNNRAVADGPYVLTFTIYDSEEGGNVLWNNNNSPITVSIINGVYSTELDLGHDIINSTGELWVDIMVGEESMSERIRLHLSPYEQNIISGGTNWFPESGPVGLGTQTPADGAMLDVAGRIKDESGFVPPIGIITMFAGSTPPPGYLICDGSELPDGGQYDALDAILNGAYGQGSRSHVPDLRGKVGLGLNSDQSAFNSVGNTGGQTAPTHAVHAHSHTHHNMENSGVHTHSLNYGYELAGSTFRVEGGTGHYASTINTSSSGSHSHTMPEITSESSSAGDQDYGNMPPYVIVNYIIKY